MTSGEIDVQSKGRLRYGDRMMSREGHRAHGPPLGQLLLASKSGRVKLEVNFSLLLTGLSGVEGSAKRRVKFVEASLDKGI